MRFQHASLRSRSLVKARPSVSRLAVPFGLLLFTAAMLVIAGCGPVTLIASARIPEPLVVKIPVAVALFMPQEFVQYIHKEERWGTDWNIEIGKAQADAMSQLLRAMFENVIPVESLNAGSELGSGIAAILEPSVEEYAFVTPRDAGSPFFAVSIKYRVNVYLPDGKLADSWGFTGYGTAPAGGLSNTEPLENATASAMRDAGAKLAVEFRDQAIVRGLLPGSETADDPAAAPVATQPSETPLPQEDVSEPAEASGSSPQTPEPAPGEEPQQAVPPVEGIPGEVENEEQTEEGSTEEGEADPEPEIESFA